MESYGEEIISYKLNNVGHQLVSDFLERNGIMITEGVRAELDAMVDQVAAESYKAGRKRAK